MMRFITHAHSPSELKKKKSTSNKAEAAINAQIKKEGLRRNQLLISFLALDLFGALGMKLMFLTLTNQSKA